MTRIIFYNIEYLEGTDGKKINYLKFWNRLIHPKGIADKIVSTLNRYKPDIVAFAEIGGKNFIEGDYFMHIKKELGMKYHIKRVKYDLRGKFNLLKKIPFMNKQSNAIMSRSKISHIETIYFHEGVKRTVIEAEIDCEKKITLILVHLALGKKVRKKQILELAKIVRKIKTPVIVAGDFNTFDDYKIIYKFLSDTGLEDKFRVHSSRIFTFPSYRPKKRLDYFLTSKEILVKKYSAIKMPFSDHLPILMDFKVKL